jgi:hypothetical protein
MMYAPGQYNIRSLGEVVKIAPVTLPALRLDDIDVEAEAREAQARVAERRVIRRGLDGLGGRRGGAILRKLENYRGGPKRRQASRAARHRNR